MTSRYIGLTVALTSTRLRLRAWATDIIMASARAVEPSYIEAFETSSPVSEHIMV